MLRPDPLYHKEMIKNEVEEGDISKSQSFINKGQPSQTDSQNEKDG